MNTVFSYAQLQSPKHFLQDDLCMAGGKLEKIALLSEKTDGVRGGAYRHVEVGPRGAIYGVFDGVGGCKEPKRAAQAAAETVRGFVNHKSALTASDEGLWKLMQLANQTIHGFGMDPESPSRSLGAAAGAVLWIPFSGDSGDIVTAYLAYVGDAVAWLWTGEELKELTPSDSRKTISNYLGVGEGMSVSVRPVPIEPDLSVVILASDGVTKSLNLPALKSLAEQTLDAERMARNVTFLAKQRGSTDDITCLAVQLES